jgi:curved DNA-binding protein CbpA
MKTSTFDYSVDPYEILGVEKGCKDVHKIKKAYKKKCLSLHPDRNSLSASVSAAEFRTLNRCYLYLKTLCKEWEELSNANQKDYNSREVLEKRLNEYESSRSNDLPRDRNSSISMSMPMPVLSTPLERRGPDFSRQLRMDNSIMGTEEFDEQLVYENMMRNRPTATQYSQIVDRDKPSVDNSLLGKFSVKKFNELFEQKKLDEINTKRDDDEEDQPDGFSNFEEISSGAAIVTDDEFMFIQAPPKRDSSIQECIFGGLLKQFPEYDREMERNRFDNVSSAPVTKSEEIRFQTLWSSAGANTSSQLSKAQFAERMMTMGAHQRDLLEENRMRNRELVEMQMSRLSQDKRADLLNWRPIAYR